MYASILIEYLAEREEWTNEADNWTNTLSTYTITGLYVLTWRWWTFCLGNRAVIQNMPVLYVFGIVEPKINTEIKEKWQLTAGENINCSYIC